MARIVSGLIAVLMLIGVAAVVAVPTTSAWEVWCMDDPVVQINGITVNIQNGVYGDEAEVRRYVRVAETTIFVPRGSSYRLISTTNSYFRETVRWVEVDDRDDARASGTPIRIVTRFDSTKDMPATMQVRVNNRLLTTDTGSTQGRPLTAQVTLPR